MLSKKVGMFLQVRLNSTRMPGKALLNLCGKPLIERVMERMTLVPADIRVLLTTKESERYLTELAGEMQWEIFCGESQNVLKRFVDAADFYNVDTIIRATGDNPLLSSEIATETLKIFNKSNADLAHLEPVPYGSGVEIINKNALAEALKNASTPYHFEHVTPYLYENKDKFKIVCEKYNSIDFSEKDIKISVDTREDFERVNHVFRNLIKNKLNFGIESVVKTYEELDFKKYKRALFITSAGGSFGMGHFKRCKLLAEKLSDEFEIYFSFKHASMQVMETIDFKEMNYIFYENLFEVADKEGLFDRVFVDSRDVPADEMLTYKSLGPVISIDDAGIGGRLSDMNIKTLPSLDNKVLYNFSGLEYLFLNKTGSRKQNPGNPPENILISFGGSDPAGFTVPVSKILSDLGYKVKTVIGPFFEEEIDSIENCEVINDPENLAELIKEADIVFTSYGMTMMESLSLETPVVVLNPTGYHDKLTLKFEYPYLAKNSTDLSGEIKSVIEKMISKRVFEYPSSLENFYKMNFGLKFDDFISTIKNYQNSISMCPYCSTVEEDPVYRTPEWNMYFCKHCGLYFSVPFSEYKDIYNDDYFTKGYKAQYGKTYEEDRDNIRILGEKRLEVIKTYKKSGDLLDFGGGMGFFSELCSKNGFNTTTVDASEFAVKYINEKLKLNAVLGDEKYFEKNNLKYDVISSFYVIEHIKDFEKLIFLFKTHLKDGGVLALSTPNASGVSVKKNFIEYATVHPKDHYRIFSVNFMKKLLAKNGFKEIKVKITGIHPERILKNKNLLESKFIYNLVYSYADFFGLGDTFEIYAKKK